MNGSDRTVSRRSMVVASLASVTATGMVAGTPALAKTAAPSHPMGALEELLAKQAIMECLYRYPRGLDRLDRDILLSVGHPEATVAFRETPFPNWAAYVDWLIKAHTQMIANNHRITNILIEVHGDTAVSESTGTATLLAQTSNADLVEERWMHSRYLDKWLHRDGRWGITSRVTVNDYRRVTPFPAADLKTRFELGKRQGRDDPSYKLFAGE